MTMLRRVLFVSLFLAGIVALFYAEENWRGQRAWARTRAELLAKGEAVDFYKLVPKRPADSENVMKVPPMEEWFIKDRGGSNTLFFESSPEIRRRGRDSGAQPRAKMDGGSLLGHLRITRDRGERLDKVDPRALLEKLVGKHIATPYGGMIYNPPASAREIELHAGEAVSAEKIARALNRSDSDGDIIVESLGADRFAVYGAGGWISAAQYLEWNTKFEKEIGIVREALKRPKVWLDGDYSRAFEIPTQNYIQMRVFAQMVATRAQALILLNRPDDAFREVQLLMEFNRIVETSPTILVSAMINCALRGLDAAVVERGFEAGIWKDSHCVAFQKMFENPGIVQRTRDAMRLGELPAIINLAETLGVEKHDKMFRFMPRGWVYLNLVEYTRLNLMVSESTALVDGAISPERVTETARQIEIEMETRSPWIRLTQIGMPSSQKAFMVSAKNENIFRHIVIACELERLRMATGKYPTELDAKAPRDVMTGKPFKYQLRADGDYVLYSVGWDLKDDLALVLRDSALSVREIFKHPSAKDDLVWEGVPERSKTIAEARR